MKPRELAVVVSATVIAIAAAELIARAVMPPPPHVEIREDPEAEARRRAEIAEGRTFEAPSSEVSGLYTYTPNGLRLRASTIAHIERHNVSGRTVEIRTNSIGFRNPEIGAKVQGRPRVLFLGDSVTNSGYMDEGETFVRRIETMSCEDGGAALETINAGVGGVGLEDELAILNETGLGTEPDVVVLCFYLNDPVPSPGVWLLPPPTWLEKSRLAALVMTAASHLRNEDQTAAHAEQVADLDAWLAQVRRDFPPADGDPQEDRAAFNAAIEENFRDWGCSWSDGAWERMEPVFREFRRLAEVHAFDLRFVCFPHRMQVEAEFVADEPQRRLNRVADELNVPYLDLLPTLREAPRSRVYEPDGAGKVAETPPLFYDHCHLTPRGSDVAARTILEFLRRGGR